MYLRKGVKRKTFARSPIFGGSCTTKPVPHYVPHHKGAANSQKKPKKSKNGGGGGGGGH